MDSKDFIVLFGHPVDNFLSSSIDRLTIRRIQRMKVVFKNTVATGEHGRAAPKALALGIILGNQTIPSTESVLGGRVVGSSFFIEGTRF